MADHVALIDDDAAVLDSLQLYLERQGMVTSSFSSASEFLAALGSNGRFDCAVADVRMPAMSGLELVQRLAAEANNIPVILITGHGDVEMAVAAIKLGAFDFIEKPFDEARLLGSIRTAIDASQRTQENAAELSELRERVESLSERQRQVMKLAARGLSNKEIGARLGISPRTVEVHRAWVMERMNARNVAELVRMVMQLGGPQ